MHSEIEQFIQWVRMRSPQARTWRDYQCDLKIFMKLTGDRAVEDVRVRDVDEFVSYQVNRGFKPSTVNRRLATVASFYTYLIGNDRPLISPVLPRRHYLKEPESLPRPVNEENLRKFFSAIQDVRDRAMCTLMLRCGLRIGEVSALEMSDLYLDDSPPRMIIRGKGARERTVYLSPDAVSDLNRWLEHRPKVHGGHVFISYQHKKLSTTSISNCIKRLRELSGVSLTAHRLRHTFADNLLSAGMPITSIQKLMGHRFVETTQTYAIANDKQVQVDFYAASERIDGWKLLLDVAQENGPNKETQVDHELEIGLENDLPDSQSIHFEIPESASYLDHELVRQLEAYRQLKSNRWRVERVVPNSRNYFNMQIAMWKFFLDTCSVNTATEMRKEHVLQYIQYRLDSKRSPKTINGNLSALRSFLSFLKEEGVEVHPSFEKIKRLKEVESLPRYMTSEQVRRVQSEIEAGVSMERTQDNLLLRAVFYLLWQGGLRSGEVESLRFSDFYISKSSHVQRLFIRDGKWRRGRTVYLTDMALGALKSYLAVRGVNWEGGYVFMRNGLPLKKEFFSERLRKIGMQMNMIVSPHRLRHTFATQLLNVGCRVTSIQKLLGHVNVDTTMTYARAFDQTVMLDYFTAVNALESQDGVWYRMNIES